MRCRPLVNYKTINSCHKDNQLPCRERPASIYRTFQEILNPCLDNHESILNLLQKYWENFPSPDFPFVPWCSKGCRNHFRFSPPLVCMLCRRNKRLAMVLGGKTMIS